MKIFHKALVVLIITVLIISLTGCKQNINNFTFTYTLESVNNYKVKVTFNDKKDYIIEEYTYFFDRMSGKHEPKEVSGKLSEEEFSSIKNMIENSQIFCLRDSYGFDQNSDILFQVNLEADGKEKFVLMREIDNKELPKDFVQLIKYINEFIGKYKKR